MQARGWLRLLMPRRLERLLENAVRTGNRTDLDEALETSRQAVGMAAEDEAEAILRRAGTVRPRAWPVHQRAACS
jgi:hypothetical protein